mmetsp:Transcript_30982/g.56299  ORF Transcript_30982/g.56299 Transcript_30982/m.56299 type:complete len:174 (-) Transcript_30982:45-566(-)
MPRLPKADLVASSPQGGGPASLFERTLGNGRNLWSNHQNPFQFDIPYVRRCDGARDRYEFQTCRLPELAGSMGSKPETPRFDTDSMRSTYGGASYRLPSAPGRASAKPETLMSARNTRGMRLPGVDGTCALAGVMGYTGYMPGFGDGSFAVGASHSRARANIHHHRQRHGIGF